MPGKIRTKCIVRQLIILIILLIYMQKLTDIDVITHVDAEQLVHVKDLRAIF
jgi:hypothetical protein